MSQPTPSTSDPQAGPSDPNSSNAPGHGDNKESDRPAHSGRRHHGRRGDEPPDVRASKALSYILRHGAAKESLTMRPDGFVRVDDLVSGVTRPNTGYI